MTASAVVCSAAAKEARAFIKQFLRFDPAANEDRDNSGDQPVGIGPREPRLGG